MLSLFLAFFLRGSKKERQKLKERTKKRGVQSPAPVAPAGEPPAPVGGVAMRNLPDTLKPLQCQT